MLLLEMLTILLVVTLSILGLYLVYFSLQQIASICIFPAWLYEKNFNTDPESFYGEGPTLSPKVLMIFGNGFTKEDYKAFRQDYNQNQFKLGTYAHNRRLEFMKDMTSCASRLAGNPPKVAIHFFHPGYSRNAHDLVHNIANYAERLSNQYPNSKLILAGYSLGGGLVARAALELKKHHSKVRFNIIISRSFHSIGSAVLGSSHVGVRKVFNLFLRSLGGWNISSYDALRAIQRIEKESNVSDKSKIIIMEHKYDTVLKDGGLFNFFKPRQDIDLLISHGSKRYYRNHAEPVEVRRHLALIK